VSLPVRAACAQRNVFQGSRKRTEEARGGAKRRKYDSLFEISQSLRHVTRVRIVRAFAGDARHNGFKSLFVRPSPERARGGFVKGRSSAHRHVHAVFL
tara:strand:+ start:925 stop:1218 length:294 start_codon:yes stop_codon:yes gene_type:complete